MANKERWDVIIVGGGLAGLSAARHLSMENCKICVIEKNKYPHHKVCGEYVSNEVLPYLNFLGIDPFSLPSKNISRFEITDAKGITIRTKLPLGGFGISRFAFDNLFYESLIDKVEIVFETVEKISFDNNFFTVATQDKNVFQADFVIGAFGKRSNIDSFLNRKFMTQNSHWLGIKGHFEYEFSDDLVALHNFEGGYCGLSKTETSAVNACYLTTFKSFKKYNGIETFQKKEMSKKPLFKKVFQRSKTYFQKTVDHQSNIISQKKTCRKPHFYAGR